MDIAAGDAGASPNLRSRPNPAGSFASPEAMSMHGDDSSLCDKYQIVFQKRVDTLVQDVSLVALISGMRLGQTLQNPSVPILSSPYWEDSQLRNHWKPEDILESGGTTCEGILKRQGSLRQECHQTVECCGWSQNGTTETGVRRV